MELAVERFMTRDVVSVAAATPFKNIVRSMVDAGVSAVPVLDRNGRVLGVVSEADLILKEEPDDHRLFGRPLRGGDRAKAEALVAADLMTHPAVTISPSASLAEAARTMRRRRVKRLPVVDPFGHLVGILSRGDLLCAFLREDEEIAREIREDVIRRTLWIDPDTVRVVVRDGVVTLDGQLERKSLIPIALELVHGVAGVVGIRDRLGYLEDDVRPSRRFSVPAAISPS